MFRFKKAKNTEISNEDVKESETVKINENIKTISIWGSPNSGKTSLSIYLAKLLASKKKNSVVIFTEFTAPPLSIISEDKELENIASIGNIFSTGEITEDLIKKNLTTIKANDYITFLGLLKSENEYIYPRFMEEQVKLFFIKLKDIFDYIIIDCQSDFYKSPLSTIGIQESDKIIRLETQSLKSVSFMNSNENLLNSVAINKNEKIIKVLNKFDKNEALSNLFLDYKIILPNCKEIHEQSSQGKMLKKLTASDSKDFKNEVKKLYKELSK